MVKPFRFARLPEIIFRNGSISGLPSYIKKFGTSFILVTGKSSFIHSEAGKELLQTLEKEGISVNLVHIEGEPSPSVIDEATEKYREGNIQCVAAIGGGSVLDAGKAISAMLRVEGTVKDYLEGVGKLNHPGTKVPFLAIPTTSGTGSEATKNAVISEIGQDGFKKSLRHDQFVPDIALLDPELTLPCPADITAAGGMDAFTQLTEAFLSPKSSSYTDAFAREGLKAIKNSLVRAFRDGSDIDARSGMAFAALNSGICLANAGLGTIHGFASTIGGMYNIPHGRICGTLMAPTNRVNVRELRKKDPGSTSLTKYAELGKVFIDIPGKSEDYYIDGFVDYLYRVSYELQLTGLSGYGIKEHEIEEIARQSGNKDNPVDLRLEEKLEILKERL